MADPAPAPAPAHRISSVLVSRAVLVAVVVALLPLLPAQGAPKIWELPHLLLLGLVISYGIFGQKSADAEAAEAKVQEACSSESYVSQMMQGSLVFDDEAGGRKDVQAWNSQYHPDDPLVMVAADGGGGAEMDGEPLLLPVRRLKPAAQEPEASDVDDDGIGEEDGDYYYSDASKPAGFGVGERDMPSPSPSSVLDADLGLSPSSSPPAPPPPPPFLVHGHDPKNRARSVRSFRSNYASAFEAQNRRDDEDAEVSSDSSFSSDLVGDGDGGGDDDGESCDEELFELATKAAPEEGEEEEVDRKAAEFIAKFREQIRLQRFGPAMT